MPTKKSSKKSSQSVQISDELTMEEVLGAAPAERKFGPKMAGWSELQSSPKVKTITIIAKTATWLDPKTMQFKSYVMEEGRIAAQVGHAVSKLKLAYAEQVVMSGKAELKNVVVSLMENPITSIVLEARDSKELLHIGALLEKEGIHFVSFEDTNPSIYGQGVRVYTALSIGPLFDWMVVGITDYLYLWKAVGNPVG
jgi:peptidyl-tRNA hydrolase